MYARIETSKLMTYKAAWLKDNKMPYTKESATCKMLSSETATYVTKEAMQILGGYGYITDYEVERMYRNAKVTEDLRGDKRGSAAGDLKDVACVILATR